MRLSESMESLRARFHRVDVIRRLRATARSDGAAGWYGGGACGPRVSYVRRTPYRRTRGARACALSAAVHVECGKHRARAFIALARIEKQREYEEVAR